MSSSYIEPPIPTPVTEEDHSDDPDLDLGPSQGDSPETVDPDQEPDLPPIGDASSESGDANATAGGSEDVPTMGLSDAAEDEAAVAAADDDVPAPVAGVPSSGADDDAPADPDGTNTSGVVTEDAPGAEVGMTEGESTFEPEEDPEGHQA